MNAVDPILDTPEPGSELTLSQRAVLRAARYSGRLERSPAGGVHAVGRDGLPVLPRFPLRTVNTLERNGYLAYARNGWDFTGTGRAVAGEG